MGSALGEGRYLRLALTYLGAVLLHGVEVIHLLPGGRRSTHEPSAGARIEDGQLIWDGADDAC